MESLSTVFDRAALLNCGEGGCYVGTCPVNCLASLVNKYLKENNAFMLFGVYQITKRLAH